VHLPMLLPLRSEAHLELLSTVLPVGWGRE
jgi:hypothetical protein